jgi:hypothetical protein
MDEEQYNKPSYDGRLHYHIELNRLLNVLHQYYMIEDIENCIKSLQLIKSWIYPYIRTEDKKEANNIMIQLRTKHKIVEFNSQRMSNVNAEMLNIISDCEGKFLLFAKDLLLPMSSDDITEWSDDEFLKGT